MNISRKAVTTLGGVFLAALLITALAPRAVRGITATLVQVTNTSANPVATVSADANFPYEAVLCAGECGGIPNSFTVPSTTTTGVPVKRLVIEDLNTLCGGGMGNAHAGLTVPPSADTNQIGGSPINYDFLLTSGNINGETTENFGHAIVRIYVDPLATVSFGGTQEVCEAIVTGHLETK
jgi:hypothetical protein